MLSAQCAAAFVLGFAAAVFIAALCGRILWRRAMFLARRAARSEVPPSAAKAEAELNAERSRSSAELYKAETALEREQAADHARQMALSAARERLAEADRLEKQCAAQERRIAVLEKKLEKLAAQNERLKEKAQESVKLKAAELEHFRRQIKQIAAQTAGFIAAEEGADSPILHIIAANADEGRHGGDDLTSAIVEQAEKAAAARRVKAARKTDADEFNER